MFDLKKKYGGRLRRATGSLAMIVVLILLVTIIFLFQYSASLFSGDVRIAAGLGDAHLLNSPRLYFLDSQIAKGEFPLWDPHTLSGMPFAAHPLSMAFYPPNLIRSVITQAETPEDTIYSLYGLLLFHLILAAVGLFALARREELSREVSLIVALAVPFSLRWFRFSLFQMPAVCTAAWTPLILVALRQALSAKSRHRRLAWIAVAAILYGFQILAGWPQIAIYATLLYVTYVTWSVCIPEVGHQFSAKAASKKLMRWTGPMVLFGLLGVAVALALILPATELIDLSARSNDHFKLYESGKDNINLSGISLFMKEGRFDSPYLSERISSIMLGIDKYLSLNLGMLILVPAALFARPRKPAIIYGILTYLALDLCMGKPFPLASLFDRFAPFAISSPSYNAILIGFPLALLAGIGLEAIFRRVAAGTFTRTMRAVLVGVGSLVVLLMSEPPGPNDRINFAWSLLPAGILLFICLCSYFRHWRPLVIGFLVLETIVCGREIFLDTYFPSKYNSIMIPFIGELSTLTTPAPDQLDEARVLCRMCNHHLWSGLSSINGYDPLILHESLQMLSDPGKEKVYNRWPKSTRKLQALALLKRRFWLVPTYVKGPLPAKTRPYPPARVVFLGDAPSIPVQEMLLDEVPVSFLDTPGEEIEIWNAESDSMLHIGYMVQHVKATEIALPRRNSALFMYYKSEDPAEISIRVEGGRPQELFAFGPFTLPATEGETRTMEFPLPDFTESEVNLFVVRERGTGVPVIERVTIRPDLTDESGRIHVIEATPDRIVLEVRDAPGPRILLFTDMMYPGWEAALDGLPVPILEANGAFKAVEVPEGTHEVRFEFRPPLVLAGVVTSLIALVAGLVVLLWSFSPRRKSVPPVREATPHSEGL